MPAFPLSVLTDTDALAALVDVIPHPIFLKDVEGRYVGCNALFCDMLGLPREEVVGRTVFEIAPPYLARIYHDADQKALSEGGAQRYVSSVRYADRMVRRGVFYKAVFRDSGGRPAGLVGIFYPLDFLLEALEM